MSSPGPHSARSSPSKRSDTSGLAPLPPSSPGDMLPATSPAPSRLADVIKLSMILTLAPH